MKPVIYLSLLIGLPWLNAAYGNERWETHSTMESSAFGKMDLGVQEDCRETNWQETNPMILSGNNDECENFSSEQKAGKWIFSYHCQASSGKGEFTSKADGLIEGFIKTSTPQGDFLLRFTSQRKGVCQIEDDE
jgi:hypothetical protein